MNRSSDRDSITGFIAGIALVLALVVAFEANASDRYKPDGQKQHQKQSQGQKAYGGDATATNEGNTLDGGDVTVEGDSVENNSSNVVLVPNNNTESCVRVFGLAFGKNGESGALGVPWRSKACDYEQAADDAFAAGERELGWFWKCQNKSLYKTFQLDGMSKDEAKHECHRKAVGVTDAYATIDKLKSDLEFLQEERQIERQQYQESKQRLNESCNESKDRILDACKGK